jgi:hypothetical protein
MPSHPRLVIAALLFLASMVSAQVPSPETRAADEALQLKDYPRALAALTQEPDNALNLYNAACAAAQLGQADLAFTYLDRAFPAGEEWLIGRSRLAKDTDFESLRANPRWTAFTAAVEQRYDEVQKSPLAAVKAELLAIHAADQDGRHRIAEVEKAHGRDSEEFKALWRKIADADADNLPKVEAILARHGWLGPKQVGPKASGALFLVIQHADLSVQQKYLPLMRQAVQSGKANGAALALLEDRIALREGRSQTYGSQIGRDPVTGVFYVMPLVDPDNVDARRADVGLPPLADYVKRWDLTWDPVIYKQQLPTLRNPYVVPPPTVPASSETTAARNAP